ncbi:MAG: hypothetical protein IT290_03570 [Deltaproteobacteria bacterium]|nr:hypothetical protein [Deltaproteobacteria bacterium]
MTPTPEPFDLIWWQVFIAGIATLAAYSFLIRENPVYRIFEHFYIGIAAAITTMAAVKAFLWPKVIKPMFGLDITMYPDGTPITPYDPTVLWYIFPLSFGMLYYFILSPRRAWLAQIVIGFSLGASAGYAFKGIFNEMLPQIYDSFRPVYVEGSPGKSISNIIFLITLLASMSCFFLTFRQRPGGAGEKFSRLGRWLLMGCFGSFFGATIMARMALLVERLQFLIDSWWPALMALLT